MNEIEMKNCFPDVPESYHNRIREEVQKQICKKVIIEKKINIKKLVVISFAAVMLIGTMTVVAAELFHWNTWLRNRFGTSTELAEQLTEHGVTNQEYVTVSENGIRISALQTLQDDTFLYILLKADIENNVNITNREEADFMQFEITSSMENWYGTYGFSTSWITEEKTEDSQSAYILVSIKKKNEVDLRGSELVLKFKNYGVMALESSGDEIYVKGEWDIPITLSYIDYSEVYSLEQSFYFGNNEVMIHDVKVTPLSLRISTDAEQVKHAMFSKTYEVTGVRYLNGNIISENSVFNYSYDIDEEIGNYVYYISLDTLIDIEQVYSILLNDGEIEIVLNRETTLPDYTDTKKRTTVDSIKEENSVFTEEDKKADISTWNLIYTREDYLSFYSSDGLYVYDITQGVIIAYTHLGELGFSLEQGGEVAAGVGGKVYYILPTSSSDTVYVWQVTDPEQIYTLDAECWPLESSFKELGHVVEITEIVPDADEHYGSTAAYARTKEWGYFYSESGTLADVKYVLGDNSWKIFD